MNRIHSVVSAVAHYIRLASVSVAYAIASDASKGATGCAALAEGAGIPTVRYTHEEEA